MCVLLDICYSFYAASLAFCGLAELYALPVPVRELYVTIVVVGWIYRFWTSPWAVDL